MAVLEKPFIDIDDQIERLVSRGLEINNFDKARRQLIKVTYYDLINGYKDMFLMPKKNRNEEDIFIKGTKLEDIIELYELDRHLRSATLLFMLDIESRFYSSIAYSLSKIYGEKEDDYLSTDNYKEGKIQSHNNKFERENLFDIINKKIRNPNQQPLKYYKRKYKNIPPWILVKDLTFGELVMLYKLSSRDVKTMVVTNILGRSPNEYDYELFSISIKIFNKFRNWAAHGGRMYNYNSSIDFPFNDYHKKVLNITRYEYKSGRGKNDFTSLIIAAMFFLKSDYHEMLEFVVNVNFYLKEYKKTHPESYEKVLSELGFSNNYYELIEKEMLHK